MKKFLILFLLCLTVFKVQLKVPDPEPEPTPEPEPEPEPEPVEPNCELASIDDPEDCYVTKSKDLNTTCCYFTVNETNYCQYVQNISDEYIKQYIEEIKPDNFTTITAKCHSHYLTVGILFVLAFLL